MNYINTALLLQAGSDAMTDENRRLRESLAETTNLAEQVRAYGRAFSHISYFDAVVSH